MLRTQEKLHGLASDALPREIERDRLELGGERRVARRVGEQIAQVRGLHDAHVLLQRLPRGGLRNEGGHCGAGCLLANDENERV